MNCLLRLSAVIPLSGRSTSCCTTSTNSPNGTEFESETAEKRQQEEQQFTSIHVAEESHAERDELGEVLNDVQRNMYAGELLFFLLALLGGFALELSSIGTVSAGIGQVFAGLVCTQ